MTKIGSKATNILKKNYKILKKIENNKKKIQKNLKIFQNSFFDKSIDILEFFNFNYYFQKKFTIKLSFFGLKLSYLLLLKHWKRQF